MTVLLEARGLLKQFAGLRALDDYSLALAPGEIVGIIGPNGAGKTTAFNLLTGFLAPTSGQIVLAGRDITHLGADRIARLGLARTFQNIRLFRTLSVLDNVRVTAQQRHPPSLLAALGSLPGYFRTERATETAAVQWLERFGLAQSADLRADALAYGDQRRLEIARAMAGGPQVLLLDEPAAGMNPSETDGLLALIRGLRKEFGVAVVLVEHDMRLVMQLCDRIQVLNYGKLIAEGAPATVRSNPAVIEAYLGTSHGAADAA